MPSRKSPRLSTRPAARPVERIFRDELDGWVEHDDTGAVESIAGPRCVDRVDGGVGIGDLLVPVDHHQHPVAADSREPGGPHQEPADDASLDIERVRGHLVDVGCIHHVRMNDQGVAHTGQELRHRTGVAGMAADRGVDPGRNQENHVEMRGVLERPLAKLEDRRNRRRRGRFLPRMGRSGQDSDLAMTHLAREVGRANDESDCVLPLRQPLFYHSRKVAEKIMGVARPGDVPLVLTQPHHGRPRIERENLRT